MKFVRWQLLLSILSLPSLAHAATCAYCSEMDAVMEKLSHAQAGSQQQALLADSTKVIKKIFAAQKSTPKDEDWVRLIELVGTATDFDSGNVIGEELLANVGPNSESFVANIRRLRESQKVDREDAICVINVLAMAENEHRDYSK